MRTQIEMNENPAAKHAHTRTNWRQTLAAYTEPRVLQVLALGFSSGLPLLLTYSTLSAWLSTVGVRRAAIGAFALVGTPYAFKFLWAPVMDRVPPPLPLGRRRGWGITVQILLIGAILCLGSCDPKHNLPRMAALALVVAFLSASQDIVIDAWRVESTNADQLSPGASMIQAGYRIGMLVSGAGSLLIADYAGWFAAYATMAALVAAGLVVFLLAPEPKVPAETSRAVESGWHAVRHALSRAVISPFRDFMQRPLWPVILVAIFGYKLGEAMAGVMSTPLYISLRFSLPEIAAASKVFGFFSIVGGVLLGGVVTTRYGILRSLILCGILQSAGNLFFVLQAVGGHRIGYLGLMCHRREHHRRNGRDRADHLYFEPVLARVHGDSDSVRAAFLDYIARAHRGGLVRRMVVREDGLAVVLCDDERRGTAGTSSFPLGRTA